MPDLRLTIGWRKHVKAQRLRRRCGLEGLFALLDLWEYCGAHRTDGDLVGMTDEDIEIASQWDGEPGLLVRSLREVGYLDGPPGASVVHDWADHQPWISSSKRRQADAKIGAMTRWHNAGRHGVPEPGCPLCAGSNAGSNAESNAGSNETDASSIETPCDLLCPSTNSNSNSNSSTNSSTNSSSNSATTSAPPLDEPTAAPVLVYPCNGIPATWDLAAEQVEHWSTLYPDLDVTTECRKALAWIEANQRKTARGMPRFLNGWLSRCNDAPNRNGNSRDAEAIPPYHKRFIPKHLHVSDEQ